MFSLIKNGKQMILNMESKNVYRLWQLLSFISGRDTDAVLRKVRVEAEEPADHGKFYN